MIFRFNHLVLKRNHFGKKSGFWVKDVSKHFFKISHFGMNWLGCFELKCQVFKFSLYGLSVRDALAKTELKTNLKTRFYARKRKNAFLLHWWGDTTVCLGDTNVSGSSVRVTRPCVLMTRPCQFSRTPKPRFFVFLCTFKLPMIPNA